MVWVGLGLGTVLIGLWLLRAFAGADVRTLRRIGASVLVGLAGLLVIGLLVAGRGGQLFWTAALLLPLAWRWWQRRRAAGRFGRPDGSGTPAAGAPPAGESAVETATLTMHLDHATGRMTGWVRAGALGGRELAELTLPELLGLLHGCREADAESVPLLETWLDRAWPGWRTAEADAAAGPATPHAGPPTRAEALAVLGLEDGADAEAIRAAHRRLMRAAHPDQGGSDWLAARINQARDVLLP